MFLLVFSSPPYISEEYGGLLTARGEILAPDLMESFLSPLVTWTIEDYLTQWRFAASSILAGKSKAAFITYVLSANEGDHLVTWPLYRTDTDVVILQNRLLFDEFPMGPRDADFSDRTTAPFSAVSEDGTPISQWTTTLDDLARYVAEV